MEVLVCAQVFNVLCDQCMPATTHFVSHHVRQVTVEVNNAMLRFLQDLFSCAPIKVVHQLMYVYFNRYLPPEQCNLELRSRGRAWAIRM